jgi:carbamoyltransferase
VLVENIRRINSYYRFYRNDKGELVCYQKPYFELAENNGELVLSNIPVSKHEISLDSLSRAEQKKVDMGGRFYRLRSIVSELGLKDVVQKLLRYQPLPEYNSRKKAEWLLMKSILTKWIKESEKPVIVVPLPTHHYIEQLSNPKPYQERFRELSRDLEFWLHDPLQEFFGYSKMDRRQFRFENDDHPTPCGHEAIANSLIKPIQNVI